MFTEPKTNTDASGLRIGIAVSRYHSSITDALLDGAVACFGDAHGAADDLEIVSVPGAFELPAICRALADKNLDAVVALGCIIAGETTHDRYIASAVAQGLALITVQMGTPVTFGVLTCQSHEQAEARAGGPRGNKGVEAMAAAIETARAIQALRERPGIKERA